MRSIAPSANPANQRAMRLEILFIRVCITEIMSTAAAAPGSSSSSSSSSLLARGIQSYLGSQPAAVTAAADESQGNNGFKRKRHVKHVVQSPNVDLETYIANYTPTVPKSNFRDKINRLLFIADVCPQLKVDSLQLALSETRKHSLDWQRYLDIQRMLNLGGSEDDRWAQVTELNCRATADKLDSEMQLFRNSLIKESVRIGLLELIEHYWSIGDVELTYKTAIRMREYCTTTKHHLEMYMLLVRLSVELQNYTNVINYANKAKQAQKNYSNSFMDVERDASGSGRGSVGAVAANADFQQFLTSTSLDIQSALALAYLNSEKFADVAMALIEAPFVSERVISNTTILASNSDIATLICLCGLASFDRRQIKEHLMSNQTVQNYLENETTLAEVVEAFYQARYGKMLDIIDHKLSQNLYLDIYLHHHVESLVSAIKRRAMLQYCIPFHRIDMNAMAQTFRTTVPRLEADIVQLITKHGLNFRIDQSQSRLEVHESDHVHDLKSKSNMVFDKTIAYGKNASLKQQLHMLGVSVKYEA